MSIGRVPGATGIQPSIVDAKGDLIVATAADSVDRLAVGTNEQRLVADSAAATGLKYVADTTNYAIAAKGDLLVGTAADTVSALTVGSANQVLTVDSTTATGLKWATSNSPTAASYTAVLSGYTTNPTIGNGYRNAYYTKTGKLVTATFEWQFGSTSTFGSGHYHIKSADLPATTATGLFFRGTGWYNDASTGNNYPLVLQRSGFDFYIYYGFPNGAAFTALTNTAPVTMAANDYIDLYIIYEATA